MINQYSNKESLRSIKSNEQRLQSLDEYEREKQAKKRLIKDSLNNPNKSKHLTFDSDNEDDDNVKAKEFIEKKVQLFDDNDEVNVEQHFNDKKIPKKQKKLQDLQARLTTTNDPRFKLSEKFLDDKDQMIDNNDDGDGDDDKDEYDNNEISIEEEKKKSLAILDKMTNAKRSTSTSTSKTKMIRFDPTKTEHKIYEIKSDINIDTANNNGNSAVKSILRPTTQTNPIPDTTRKYEFDKLKLKEMFNKTSIPVNSSQENGKFQFEFFHQTEEINPSVPKIIQSVKQMSNGKSKILFNKSDNTSSDDDDDDHDHNEISLPNETKTKEEQIDDTFFFFDIDDRLKEGLQSFVRTEDLNELEKSWPKKRKEIGEALRTKHRKAIQRRDKRRILNHRRQQKQQLKSLDSISTPNID